MNKFLFIYPPCCYPVSPYMSIPLLSSILNEYGVDSSCYDLNLEFFYKRVLNKNYLLNRLNYLKEAILLIDSNKFVYTDFQEQQIILKSLPNIRKYLVDEKQLLYYIEHTDFCIDILTSKTKFYNSEKVAEAINILNKCMDFLYLSFFVTDNLVTKFGYNIQTLLYLSKNSKLNPFYDFILEEINLGSFKSDKYNIFCISQAFDIQTVPTFTLMYLLKKSFNDAKICIGGNYISRLSSYLYKNKVFFDEYIDYALLGLGEESILEFADFLSNKRPSKDVSGLIYYENNDIMQNKIATKLKNLNKRPKIKFDGIDLKRYLIPEVVIPLQISKGCPWGKCSFCIFHEGKTSYQVLKPSQVAKELEYLNKTYGITKFEFADESLTPSYYFDLANEIIKLNLNILYYGFARLEDGYTDKILQCMYKSGFRMFQWGFETPIKRIFELYNKGVKFENRLSILKRVDKNNLWNHCLTIVRVPFQMPSEEIEELKYYLKNKSVFHSRLLAKFELYKKAPLYNNKKLMSELGATDKYDFSIKLCFNRKYKATLQEETDIRKYKNELYYFYSQFLWLKLLEIADEYLFLYLAKYGTKHLKNMKIKDAEYDI